MIKYNQGHGFAAPALFVLSLRIRLEPPPFAFDTTVSDGFGANVPAAALVTVAAAIGFFVHAFVMQAKIAVGIFDMVFKFIVYSYIFGHYAPSFAIFDNKKSRALRLKINGKRGS